MRREAVVFVFLVALWSCSGEGRPQVESQTDLVAIYGETQGTTYSVKFLDPKGHDIKKSQIDSILLVLDNSLSSWVKSSTISQFNGTDSIVISDPHFITVFYRGKELSEITGGTFHPMIMPLAKVWGFGPEGGTPEPDVDIDALRDLVNFDFDVVPVDNLMDTVGSSLLFLKAVEQQLDVNSYAQGYSVDVVAAFLEGHGIVNYMVEIGGEIVAKGVNETGAAWRVGIDKPVGGNEERVLEAIVSIDNAAIATSGTYRKFYEKDGKKYSHMIDPSTGRPVEHNLLSATVMADNCMNADAFATAFMVMGAEKAKEFVKTHPEFELEVFLIYDGGVDGFQTYASEGMNALLEIP